MVQLKKKLSGRRRAKPVLPVTVSGEMPEPDIQVVTATGYCFPAHSKILSSASPVLENVIERLRERRSTDRNLPILGVPNDAVAVFIQFLYSFKCSEEHMENYGVHLLALSHVFMVAQLKRRCTKGLARRMTVDNVVDVLQLAKLCDAPDLYLSCVRLLSNNFRTVEESEGWKFLQKNDPYLELEILQFIDEVESRKKRMRKQRREQEVYRQLSEAMDCLEHICSEGCTNVGPYDMDPRKHKGPCSKFSTCQGIQLLIKHFGTCKNRANGGCSRCTRMWQLFRLHSLICDRSDECRVPLCRQFKLKVQQDRKESEEGRWRLLAKKVSTAKAMSSLSFLKREDMRRGNNGTGSDENLVKNP